MTSATVDRQCGTVRSSRRRNRHRRSPVRPQRNGICRPPTSSGRRHRRPSGGTRHCSHDDSWCSGLMRSSVVTIGGDAGGLATALSLRDKGFDGSIEIVSDEELAPYLRPPLSKEFLRKGSTADGSCRTSGTWTTTSRSDWAFGRPRSTFTLARWSAQPGTPWVMAHAFKGKRSEQHVRRSR
jgi:hypothetical protein